MGTIQRNTSSPSQPRPEKTHVDFMASVPSLSSGYENIRIVAEKLFHSRATPTEDDSISHRLADKTSAIRTFNRKLSHLYQIRASQSEHSRLIFKGSSFISKNSYCILSILHLSISRVLVMLTRRKSSSRGRNHQNGLSWTLWTSQRSPNRGPNPMERPIFGASDKGIILLFVLIIHQVNEPSFLFIPSFLDFGFSFPRRLLIISSFSC